MKRFFALIMAMLLLTCSCSEESDGDKDIVSDKNNAPDKTVFTEKNTASEKTVETEKADDSDIADEPENTAEPEITDDTTETADPVDVPVENTIAVPMENLAVSLALTYHTAAWKEPVDTSDPLFFWQTIGWYTIYNSQMTGTDNTLISNEDAAKIRQILAPDTEEVPLPADFPYGSAAENGYSFDGTKVYFDSYVGIVAEMYVQSDDGLAYTVNFIDHYDTQTIESEYRVVFSGSTDSPVFDSIKQASISSTPVNEGPINFTYDDLRSSNLVDTLLGYGKTIRITSEYEDAEFVTYIEKNPENDAISVWYSDGTGGYYNNFYFFTDEGRVRGVPMLDNGEWLNSYVSDSNFDYLIKMEYVSEDEESITFRYDFGSYFRVITVDRGSLAIRTAQLYDETGKDMGLLRYEYGDFGVSSPVADDWTGEMRTVTLKIHEITENDVLDTTETHVLPVSWELDPYACCPWGEAYLDENFTETYVFPEGSGDYTIYITNMKG